MTLILSGTDGLSDVDGSAATPAIRGTDANTGIFFPAADTIAFAEGGAEVARFDSSGRLGIGTTSPASLFTVNGDTRLQNGGVLFYEDTNVYTGRTGNSYFVVTDATERMRITSDGLLQFNSGYGSVSTAYGCRAWVNFNGTGTVAIRASGNVSSITDNGTGDYTVNFTTAMPDVNYSSVVGTGFSATWQAGIALNTTGSFVESVPTTSSFRFACVAFNVSTSQDPKYCNVSIFR
jgi:hypothetical protein